MQHWKLVPEGNRSGAIRLYLRLVADYAIVHAIIQP